MKTAAEAEEAGYKAGRYGADTTNCHSTYFATPELTKAWERGNATGKELATKYYFADIAHSGEG